MTAHRSAPRSTWRSRSRAEWSLRTRLVGGGIAALLLIGSVAGFRAATHHGSAPAPTWPRLSTELQRAQQAGLAALSAGNPEGLSDARSRIAAACREAIAAPRNGTTAESLVRSVCAAAGLSLP
jgi:hypothetical protein